jgi:WbqC-like protein family
VKIAIMQPYFFPYIGYFQLMNAVDEFVVYDNIEYTKKGWINRNRILVNERDSYITLPLKKASDYLDIGDRYLAESWSSEKYKLLNRMIAAYRKAPYFNSVFPMIERCILFEECNLFAFILHSLCQAASYLKIQTSLLISSSITVNDELKGEKRVIEICKARSANSYLNPIGGIQLYSKDRFKEQGLDLHFLKTNDFSYKQFNNDFVPFLSIIDVIMFNSIEEIKGYLDSFYTLM